MTNLSKFDFIIFYRYDFLKEEDRTYNVDPTNHNFYIDYKYSDDSGCKAICNQCKISVHVIKKSPEHFKFYLVSIVDFNILKLSCNEICIKNLLE